MSSEILLCVGLGNPGARYADTRHNAGFWWLDLVARELGAQLRQEKRFKGHYARAEFNDRAIHLLAPQTFMNLSGSAVASVVNFHKIPLAQVLVAHDDLDLAPGTIRLKRGGGAGGHNGLRDISETLGTGFARVRIGIGHPGVASEVENYVLRTPPSDERDLIMNAIETARNELSNILEGRFELAMNVLHQKRNGTAAG